MQSNPVLWALWLPYFHQQGLTSCADWSTIKAQNAMAHYSLASIGLLASLRAAMCAVKSCVVSVVIALFPPAGIDIMCWLVHYQGTKCYGTLFPCKHRSSGQLASCYVCSQILCCERCDCLISTSRDWHHVLTGPLSRHKMAMAPHVCWSFGKQSRHENSFLKKRNTDPKLDLWTVKFYLFVIQI